MRIVVSLLAASLVFSTASIVSGQEAPSARETAPAPVEESRESRLDTLFATLKSTQDPKAAKAAETAIIALWQESGSDTVDLLMSWISQAIDEKDYSGALDFLDRVIALKPDFAEAWNRRATVYFLNEEYARSVADIEMVLAIEPRHFGALSGLGSILRELGDKERAIEAFRAALALDPHLENVKEALAELEKETAGSSI